MWTHGIVNPPRELVFLLLLVVVVNSVWNTLATVLFATNRHKGLAVVYLVGATLSMATAIPLCSAFALPGAAMALLVIETGMVGYVLPAAMRVVEDRPQSFLRSTLDVRETMRSVKSCLQSRT